MNYETMLKERQRARKQYGEESEAFMLMDSQIHVEHRRIDRQFTNRLIDVSGWVHPNDRPATHPWGNLRPASTRLSTARPTTQRISQ